MIESFGAPSLAWNDTCIPYSMITREPKKKKKIKHDYYSKRRSKYTGTRVFKYSYIISCDY